MKPKSPLRLQLEARDVPGMLGLCTYDRSVEGRAARAGYLLFAAEPEPVWPEVGEEWETEGEDSDALFSDL